MGAIPHTEGVAFRVWAPHAKRVHVTGDFNDWAWDPHPLASEGEGYWSVDVPEAAPGHEYKFVVEVEGDRFLRGDPYARCVVHSSGNSVVYDGYWFDWQSDAFETPLRHELVIYEMHVGTFSKGADGQRGTFYSAVDRLDQLADLGINAVEVMPVAEFAGDRSWGYNPAYPFSVESSYGGAEGLKTFVREAHARGIAVLVDVVFNHLGPTDLPTWRFDGWHEGDYGGIYFYNDERADTPWGRTRPDYGRPEVRRYLRDNALMWMDEFRADGLRWDGTVFIRRTSFDGGQELPDGWQFMRDTIQELHDRHPKALMIAEDLQGEAALTRPASDGGAGFGAQWDASFVHRMREQLRSPSDDARSVHVVRNVLLGSYNDDPFQRVVYVESHDEVANGRARLTNEIAPQDETGWASRKRSLLGAALVCTAPGIPMLFQGQELLEDRWFSDEDPLDWSRRDEFEGIYAAYRDLVRLRRNLDGHTRGLSGSHVDVLAEDDDAKLLVVHRWADGGAGDSTVVAYTLSTHAVEGYECSWPADGRWRVRFNSDASVYGDDFGQAETSDVDVEGGRGRLTVGPYAAVILSQDPA